MTYQNNVFKTNEWFKKIQDYSDFHDMRVVDLGCAEGVMSRMAGEAGARSVIGIDKSLDMIHKATQDYYAPPVKFILEDLTQVEFRKGYYTFDIAIASMIIHWIGDAAFRKILATVSDRVAVIWRTPHESYQIPQNGVWFPDKSELTQFMESAGFGLNQYKKELKTHDGKRISLATYRRYKGVERRGDKVRKTDRMSVTEKRYIDGVDLFGDLPFDPKHKNTRLFLTPRERENLIIRFIQHLLVLPEGAPRYTDVNMRNILFDGTAFHFIDQETISKEDAIPIYQQLIDYLKIDYTFTGDLDDLRRTLIQTNS